MEARHKKNGTTKQVEDIHSALNKTKLRAERVSKKRFDESPTEVVKPLKTEKTKTTSKASFIGKRK